MKGTKKKLPAAGKGGKVIKSFPDKVEKKGK